ncbi:MAG TPA: response regulator [Verrucomicrobiae bacterium]|nr:response regulator [Verrucomicrobiae bacterium]
MNRRKILLADGDEPVRKMLSRVLESAGYEAVLARDIPEAMEQVQAARPDLLLLDMENPSQQSLLQPLREAEPDLPVILMTGWRSGANRALRESSGPVLEKPLDLGLLLQRIEELLRPALSAEGRGA